MHTYIDLLIPIYVYTCVQTVLSMRVSRVARSIHKNNMLFKGDVCLYMHTANEVKLSGHAM